MEKQQGDADLLTPAEVARLFRVDPKTVSRWATEGKVSEIRTLGGHRRFRASEIYALLAATAKSSTPSATPMPGQPRT